MDISLKSCPFCGSTHVTIGHNDSRFQRRYYFVECNVCRARTRGDAINLDDLGGLRNELDNPAVRKAVTCWNQRAVRD
ncbi:MAG: Lar family restriction alleviation protein [Clostridia bacterium]|nr:Lar family restriction alleviation protein [Clostridia bacterium]